MYKGCLVIVAVVPCLFGAPFSVGSARAQTTDGVPPAAVPQLPVPLEPEQWQPDPLQRALVNGTTIPVDAPLSDIPEQVTEPPLNGNSSGLSETVPPGTNAPLTPPPPTAATAAPEDVNQPATPTASTPTPAKPTSLDTGVPLEPDIADPNRGVPVALAPLPEEPKWFVSLYAGKVTLASLLGALTFDKSDGMADSYLVAADFGRELTRLFGNSLSLDVTGQVVQHFGDQDHTEFTAALALRWNDFPWNKLLNTTIAVGEGLSFATKIPALEEERRDNTSQLLNFLLFEITFALPQHPNWLLVGRINHRSGVFGLFNGVVEGSNNYAIGIRHKFR